MLRITVNRSATGAKKYYTEKYYSEGQSRQNYYSEKDQAIGIWGGKAAEKLKLTGEIKKEDFCSLCDNEIPGTNNKLTGRNNIERRVGYDFTFNASKSVSLAYTFGTEEEKRHLLKAFRESVEETMSVIETGAQARVRVKGQNTNRETGNIAYGEFVHFTGRPVDGVPDPHLHAHCFVFNVTQDQVENKWKAGEFGQINKDAPYYEAVFHANFANRLKSLGYSIERAKTGFEIKGISRETIGKFSRRTNEIEHIAHEKGITNKDEKAKLGANTRESKREAITELEQEKNWRQRLTIEEKQVLQKLKTAGPVNNKNDHANAAAAVKYSLDHHLERRSVVTDKEILTSAIKSSLGETTPEQIKRALLHDSSVITVKEKNQTFITTKEALREENDLIAKTFATKGKYKPINENYQPKTHELNDEQKNAIRYALSTSDGISIIIGKAGVGKTTLMKEVQIGIKEAGKEIFAFAHSADASRGVQREEGFENAETLATLIHNKRLQEKIKNSVVWIDEAGMVSNKDMNKVLDILNEQNAKLILTGDTKQHRSVERGDALRNMIQEGGIIPIQIDKIQRQKNKTYREAVSFLSKGNVDKGFDKLDKMGVIHEFIDADERVNKIATDYVISTHGKNSNQPPKEVLVVSPTHAEGNRVTQEIREKLKQKQIISTEEKKFRTFKNIQLTAAEKQKSENYGIGNWIIFNQNTKGIKAKSRFEIVGTEKNNVIVKDYGGKTLTISTNKAAYYNVFEPKDVSISKGDKIRITDNGKASDGKHLFNGTAFKVTGFDKQGNVKLSNGSTISKDFGHFSLGYVITSHASQGKTVDKVIISQSTMSFRASSQEQFYVSVSRGRKAVAIYTDDKKDLLHAVSQTNERKSAVELTRQKQLNNVIDISRRGLYQKIKDRAKVIVDKVKTINKNRSNSNEYQRNHTAKVARRER